MTITIRQAAPPDAEALTELRALMFDAMGVADHAHETWKVHASTWFERNLATRTASAFVAENASGELVAAAVGTIEQHAPSPRNPDGQRGHISNVVTREQWRRQGYARECVQRLLQWFSEHSAVSSIDLFATSDGADLYKDLGFELRPYPAMRFEVPR